MDKKNTIAGLPPKYYALASSILKFVEQVERSAQNAEKEEKDEAKQ